MHPNYFEELDVSFLKKRFTKNNNGPIAKLSNNTTIQSNRQDLLPFSTSLNNKGRDALVYPDLKNAPLLFIGQLCDVNCITFFNKYLLEIINDK